MLKSNNPTAIQSQKWIIEALLNLMETNEYDKITVSEICRKAELDRRTFYRNFNSKNDVLEQYISILSNKYIETLKDVENPTSYSFTKIFFEFWKEHSDFIKNIQACGLSDFVFKRFEQFTEKHGAFLTSNNPPKSHEKYVFAYRIGGFWNVMLTWIADDTKISPDEMATVFAQI